MQQTDLDKQMAALKHLREIARCYYPEHVQPIEDVYYKISGVRLPGSYKKSNDEKVEADKK